MGGWIAVTMLATWSVVVLLKSEKDRARREALVVAARGNDTGVAQVSPEVLNVNLAPQPTHVDGASEDSSQRFLYVAPVSMSLVRQ